MMGKVTETLVKVILENHFYKWNGNIKKQTEGAAMGVRASGSLARVSMDQWSTEFKQRLTSCNIRYRLVAKYVDDVLTVTEVLDHGARYEDGRVTFHPHHREEDFNAGLS